MQAAQAAFFSYSRDDSEFAIRLAEDLKAAGANVWMDQLDIEPGEPWDRTVENAVTNCPHMLVILSPTSVNSDNVRDEISFALSKQKRVIPVLYRECDVPFRLARLQHIDFRTDYSRGLNTLLRILHVERPSVVAKGVEISGLSRESLTTEVSDAGERKRATEEALEKEHKQAEQARLEEERKQDAKTELIEHELKAQQRAEQARRAAQEKEREIAEAQRNAVQAEQGQRQTETPRTSRERGDAERMASFHLTTPFFVEKAAQEMQGRDPRHTGFWIRWWWLPLFGCALVILLAYFFKSRPHMTDYDQRLSRASKLEGSGNLDSAIAAYREMVRLYPTGEVHRRFATVLDKKGDYDAAIVEYRELLDSYPYYWTETLRLLELLAAKHSINDLYSVAQRAVKMWPDDYTCHYYLGLAMQEKNDVNGAIQEFRASLRIYFNNAPEHNNLGALLERKGDRKGALEAYQNAVRVDPNEPSYRANVDRLSR